VTLNGFATTDPVIGDKTITFCARAQVQNKKAAMDDISFNMFPSKK
jgi:hypothetical protein